MAAEEMMLSRAEGAGGSERTARGFTLLELLVVLAILCIVAAIALVSGRRVLDGSKERAVVAELHKIAEVQTQFRVALNRRRFGTLTELHAAEGEAGPLLAEPLPGTYQGWTIAEADAPTSATLLSAFAIRATPPANGPAYTYCVHEDKVVRRSEDVCGRASTRVP